MIALVCSFALANVFFYSLLSRWWSGIGRNHSSKNSENFTVIVPARNEEKNIRSILSDLSQQDFPKGRFEVLVVDDFSDDETANHVMEFQKSSDLNLNLISLSDSERGGKKHAITRGVKEAANEIILTTDADCRVGAGWISSYNDWFDENVHLVAGPVTLVGGGLFAALQKVEFAGLMAFAGGTISIQTPITCSGANLGFRKSSFLQVGGYESNIQIASGDDEFLLYDIARSFPGGAIFMKSVKAIVKTGAHTSVTSFLNQRARWISKWKFNRNWKLRLLAPLFFADHVVFLMALAGVFAHWIPFPLFLAVFILRFLSNHFLISKTEKTSLLRRYTVPLLLIQIIYPLHVSIMGLLSIFGRYTWKGRRY